MKPLGPIGSYQGDGVDPTNMFYVDLTDRLDDDETVSTAYVTTAITGITLSSVGPTTTAITKADGTTVAIGQAVKFRPTITTEQEKDVPIIISYETSDNNADTIETSLSVLKKVK